MEVTERKGKKMKEKWKKGETFSPEEILLAFGPPTGSSLPRSGDPFGQFWGYHNGTSFQGICNWDMSLKFVLLELNPDDLLRKGGE